MLTCSSGKMVVAPFTSGTRHQRGSQSAAHTSRTRVTNTHSHCRTEVCAACERRLCAEEPKNLGEFETASRVLLCAPSEHSCSMAVIVHVTQSVMNILSDDVDALRCWRPHVTSEVELVALAEDVVHAGVCGFCGQLSSGHGTGATACTHLPGLPQHTMAR